MECKDRHCAVHKEMATRGREFIGRVLSASQQRTVTVEWPRVKYNIKYERYERARTRIKAHATDCISPKAGDLVRVRECRPVSKTKKFVVVEKIEDARAATKTAAVTATVTAGRETGTK